MHESIALADHIPICNYENHNYLSKYYFKADICFHLRTAVSLDLYTIWALPAFLTHFCTDWVETTAVFMEANVPGTIQDYDIERGATHINRECSLLI